MRLAFASTLATGALLFASPLTSSLTSLPSASLHAQQNIVQTARSAGTFKTLLAAVDAAGLTSTLEGRGPFTVFAPSDEAFAKLPKGTVESLLQPENREQLKALLLYHVVSGRVPASAARTLDRAATVEGREVRIRTSGRTLRINDSRVVAADVDASNGVIHVIDAVLMPPAPTRAAAMPTSSAKARDLLDLAIRRGAPLFNDGSPEATAALYEITARAILALDGVPPRATRALEYGLRDAGRERSAREQAWTLREALEKAGAELDTRVVAEREAARPMTPTRRRSH